MYTPWDEAFRRNALHYLKTGRLVPPHFFDEIGLKPRGTFDSLIGKGILFSWSEIDNSAFANSEELSTVIERAPITVRGQHAERREADSTQKLTVNADRGSMMSAAEFESIEHEYFMIGLLKADQLRAERNAKKKH